jgi:hypothetical protein
VFEFVVSRFVLKKIHSIRLLYAIINIVDKV